MTSVPAVIRRLHIDCRTSFSSTCSSPATACEREGEKGKEGGRGREKKRVRERLSKEDNVRPATAAREKEVYIIFHIRVYECIFTYIHTNIYLRMAAARVASPLPYTHTNAHVHAHPQKSKQTHTHTHTHMRR